MRRHDGEYRWQISRFSAHRDENGEILLWVGTSTDIEEQKENEQRKDEFLSIASHELKTPLTSIKAFNQIMARSAADVKLKKFMGGTWFPMMEKAGLKHLAHVLSPITFGQLDAKKSIDIMAGIVKTQYVTDFSSVEEWLDGISEFEN